MATTKSKLQMECNNEVTSAAPDQVYACFGSFLKYSVKGLRMRDNVQSEGPEYYFRKSVTVPFLNYTLNEMKTRFTDLDARTTLGL
jgi:hypothetical protein